MLHLILASENWIDFYQKFLLKTWREMTPMEYGSLLIGIAAFGWILMKSGSKR